MSYETIVMRLKCTQANLNVTPRGVMPLAKGSQQGDPYQVVAPILIAPTRLETLAMNFILGADSAFKKLYQKPMFDQSIAAASNPIQIPGYT
jgi:hypothetical protein